jgi:hypothetical protein
MAVEFPVRAVLDNRVLDQLIAALNKAGKAAGMSEKEIKEMNDELRKTGKDGVKGVNSVNDSLNNMVNDGIKKVGGAFLAAFAIDRLVAFGEAIVDITAEFQKMEAVLTNTLGSKSAAHIAMFELTQFAAKTPFSVQELTASYVKLVNQGFKPTLDELRKLGDLSASTGKEFDMLAEAIIDAQTGEFERLKEFGIRASKEGDKVSFTFKGVKTQVDFTAESIRNYITSLGDAQGVSGAMAAISETLGGSISNMGDAWTTFMNTLGDGEKGPLQNAVRNITKLIEIATDWVETEEQKVQKAVVQAQAGAVKVVEALANTYGGDVKKAAEEYIVILERQAKAYSDMALQVDRIDENGEAIEGAKARADAFELEWQKLNGQIQAIKDYVKSAENKKLADEESAKAAQLLAAAEQAKADALFDAWVKQHIMITARQKANAEEMDKLVDRNKVGLEETASDNDAFRKLQDKQWKEWHQKTADAYLEEEKRRGEEELKLLVEKEERKRQIMESTGEFINILGNALFDAAQIRTDNEIKALNEKRDYELEMAGSNAAAKTAINNKYDTEEKRLKTKQAIRDRDQALFNIGVNTAQGVVAALASVPPNVPLSIAIGIIGALQAGVVASRPLPKFAHGVFDLDGPGTETSDSIPAMLSKHETVAPARATKKFPSLLRELVENPNLTWMDIKQIVDQNIPSRMRGDILVDRSDKDGGSELLNEFREMRRSIENKQELHLDIDENGFRKWTRSGNQWTEYVDNRYSF